MTETIDSYANSDTDYADITTVGYGIGQTFSMQSLSYILQHAKFYIYRDTGTNGSFCARLYDVTGTVGSSAVPTGAAIETSAPIDAGDVGTSGALVTFDFSGDTLLEAGHDYAITVEIYSNVDAELNVWTDYSGSHSGNLVKNTGGSWEARSSEDAAFYILGYEDGAIFLTGSGTERWEYIEVIDSITKGAKSFSSVLENTDGAITDSYEAYDTAVVNIDGTTVFNGRIEEITPNESEATVELSGRDYLGDLIGEFIIESYGISQDLQNNEIAGSNVVIEIADTTGFEVGDEVQIQDDNGAETATLTAVITNTSITVDVLSNSYTTAANATVAVGRLGSYIVDDLVQKYATSLTRTGIQTSGTKFIILFKGITAFDAIQQIADAEEYEFGHDETLDFFYQPSDYEDSGSTIDLDTDDVLEYNFPRPGYDIVNRVDIYGATTGGTQVAIRVEDLASQELYGVVKGETVVDEKIITVDQAYAKGNAVLAEKAYVIQTGEISVLGYETLKAGQLVSLENFDSVQDGTYLVTQIRREMPPGIAYISVAEYRTELEDVIVDLIRRMREREKESIDEDAVQTKFLNFYENEAHSDIIVEIVKLNINDGYVAGHETNSIAGRGYTGVGSTVLKCGRYVTQTVIV